jgi:hypothetical protein
MSYPSEKVRISPLLGAFATVGGTSLVGKTIYNGQGDFSVRCRISGGLSSLGATQITATAAANWDFSVLESTAATAAGSVIAGATMTLGAAAALTLRGAVNLVCKVASNLATTINLTLNGYTYHISTAGATAKNGAVALTEAINGQCTGATAIRKLPHYLAYCNSTIGYSSANLMLVTADDDLGTGITAVTVTGGVKIFVTDLQGVIDVQQSKLSTQTPKYIGVGCTALTGLSTSIITADLISFPTGGPSFPGVKVSCTT